MDWRNWVAEEFNKLKKSPWTPKNYPKLKNIDYDDLVKIKPSKTYMEAPQGFPAVMQFTSTGAVERKTIKFSQNDFKKIILSVGRHIWLIRGEPRFRNALMIGELGLVSGAFMRYVSYTITKRFLFVENGKWREKVNKIIKHGPYDLIGMPLPCYIDFLRNFKHDVYWDLTIWIGLRDIMTSKLRNMVINKGEELGKIFYPLDTYDASECIILGMEIPPNVVNSVLYAPETNILFIKKENGEVINIFDAKVGDRGEALVTPLFDYMVPNYKLHDIIEITEDETEFGLPAFKIIGRKGVRVELDLETMGEVKGYFSMYARVMGVVIDGRRYTDFLGKHFETDQITLVKERNGKVIMETYVEVNVDIDKFMELLKKDDELFYLHDDIRNGIVKLNLIRDPEFINEVKKYYYEKYGSQATIPRIIILDRDT